MDVARNVTIEPVAVGRDAGTVDVMINPDNPTVSTASHEMISASAQCSRVGGATLEPNGSVSLLLHLIH